MMDLPWGDEKTTQFVTNVGLITSTCPHGDNVMACEWTHHVSYMPGQIAIFVKKSSATNANIKATKEFGVNLASDKQNILSSISGRYSGAEIDKISLLKEFGAEFYKGKYIKALMLKEAALNAELKLIKHEVMGDHIIFIGEVIYSFADETVKPILYSGKKYWQIGENIKRPEQEILDKIALLAEKYKK